MMGKSISDAIMGIAAEIQNTKNLILSVKKYEEKERQDMYMIYGYNLDKIEITQAIAEKCIQALKESQLCIPFFGNLYEHFCSHKEKQESNDTLPVFKSWLRTINKSMLTQAECLAQIIEQNEHIQLAFCENVIGCPLKCPWEYPDSIKDLTEEKLHSVLAKYIHYISPDAEIELDDYAFES